MKKLLMAAAAITLMMTMTMLTSCTSEDDSPITSPEPEQLADYTILFYGNGGASLDEEILENLTQFYQGKTESYEHMNIVAQYKFSTEECLREFKYSTPEADKNYGSQSIRFVVEHDADKTYKNFDDILTQDMIYGEKNADLSCTDSLTNFINWAAKTYPAKHYMLILYLRRWLPPVVSTMMTAMILSTSQHYLSSAHSPTPPFTCKLSTWMLV